MTLDLIRGREHIDQWEREIRDPAAAAHVPTEDFHAGKADALIKVAPVPAGWAWRAESWLGSYNGSSSPWTGPYATRQEAHDAALAACSWTFARSDHPDALRMLALLDQAAEPTLFDEDDLR